MSYIMSFDQLNLHLPLSGQIQQTKIHDSFSYFPQKIGFDVLCKLPPEIRKKTSTIFKCSLLQLIPGMLSVRDY